MIFYGTIFKRSEGPPPETEIQRLNPQRPRRILMKTRWPRLQAGSLNLHVDNPVVLGLGTLSPFFHESADEVTYPDPHKPLLLDRQGYLYYRGVVSRNGRNASVLVRRAINPLPDVVELLAAVRLRDELEVGDKDGVEVCVYVTSN